MFIPAILLVLFLLNSFMLKETEPGNKTTEGTKLFTGMTLPDKPLIDSSAKVPVAKVNRSKSGLGTYFSNLLMADKPGRTLAMGYLQLNSL
ncbi:MAG: hypothetical protein ACOH2A_04405 [Sphingobacteriaceae bacterium]